MFSALYVHLYGTLTDWNRFREAKKIVDEALEQINQAVQKIDDTQYLTISRDVNTYEYKVIQLITQDVLDRYKNMEIDIIRLSDGKRLTGNGVWSDLK